jgi:hypothetical protein
MPSAGSSLHTIVVYVYSVHYVGIRSTRLAQQNLLAVRSTK